MNLSEFMHEIHEHISLEMYVVQHEIDGQISLNETEGHVQVACW